MIVTALSMRPREMALCRTIRLGTHPLIEGSATRAARKARSTLFADVIIHTWSNIVLRHLESIKLMVAFWQSLKDKL